MSNTGLTGRQLEVLRLVAAGDSYEEVAKRLGISHWTVREHMDVVLRRLEVPNRTAAVVVAIRDGDIDPASLSIRRR